ncbi:glycosyltransferase family 1 protein [Pleomassaria siparia CBS 279.74]|uniref:Glycosyltransferase family 1 protein n=1 Tax=Pleomassaria siparia CBS 279.74 TaxID=1314801 RepID=A0A6G1JSX8_9PLEO|nr:glycosyltransferase family 1 protein [Pleomassaria siparia CBS 279.74]
MADDSGVHISLTSVPTTLHWESLEFLYTTPDPSSLKPSATASSASSRHSHQTDTPITISDDSRPPSDQPLPTPSSGESATERPRPAMRSSLLGRRRANSSDKKLQSNRQNTLTQDPYLFSSSSSEDEDEDESPRPINAKGEVQHVGQDHEREEKDRIRNKSTGGSFSKFTFGNDNFNTKGKVSKFDGRLKLSINETMNNGYFAKTLGSGLKKHFNGDGDLDNAKSPVEEDTETEEVAPEDDPMESPKTRLKLNIVVIVIGSRGDIQPFIKVSKILKEDYGHRVRVATHPAFKEFIEKDSGLEFFSVGGDPSELMAFMVKNPGLIPSVETIKEGEIGKRRAAMFEMFQGMWRACINSTDDEKDDANMKMMGDKHPFVADAIIANPPSFAPPHIAERLGIPLHMMFTFPYTPTVQFPHPLANIKTSNVDANYTNFMSYPLVEMMTWQGLGDLINRFRLKTLHIDEVSTLWAPGQLYRLNVPYTYMWSPTLVPKPKDWGPEVDIAGFVFLDLASSFKPPDDLAKFLDDGSPPIYIGFGSIVVDDPNKFTKLIFDAIEMAGVRALVSKGWGGIGGGDGTPDNIFMLENTPHDWLFPRVSAVVHHGGAGTTAIGLKCGKPTMIVPFFGDQPFWGAMVAQKKAGAHECIPYKELTAERLAEGIKQCLSDEAKANMRKIAESIDKEGDGALNAVRSFHRNLPLEGKHSMRCSLLTNRVATWKLKDSSLRLSPLAAELLVDWKKVKWNQLRLLRHFEWNDFGGAGEPFTGGWSAILGTAGDVATGVGLVPVNMVKSVKRREKYYEKKRMVTKRKKERMNTLDNANVDIDSANGNADGTTNGTTNGTGKDKKSRPGPGSRRASTVSTLNEPEDPLAAELLHDATHGAKKSGLSLLKAPMHFSLALTQGFHNAPRLYGDETVRRPPRITGFHSGLRAGRDEFVYGIKDGVTGLWKLPVKGAKEGGVLGCMRGVGMGVGGLVLKDIAAFLGPATYFMKGLDEEAGKKHQPTAFIRRARIIQGQNEINGLLADEGEGRERTSADGDGDTRITYPETRVSPKRSVVEKEVGEGWVAVQEVLKEEKIRNKSGIRASLMGRGQMKESKDGARKKAVVAKGSAPLISVDNCHKGTSQKNAFHKSGRHNQHAYMEKYKT